MSSLYVREQIKTFFASISTEKLVDISDEYSEVFDMVSAAGVGENEDWVGIQFLGGEELPVSLTANNSLGKYREFGSIYIHIVAVAKLGGLDDILQRAETLRDAFRGQRINNITVDAVSPPNTGTGAALSFEGGYTAAVFTIDYRNEKNLP